MRPWVQMLLQMGAIWCLEVKNFGCLKGLSTNIKKIKNCLSKRLAKKLSKQLLEWLEFGLRYVNKKDFGKKGLKQILKGFGPGQIRTRLMFLKQRDWQKISQLKVNFEKMLIDRAWKFVCACKWVLWDDWNAWGVEPIQKKSEIAWQKSFGRFWPGQFWTKIWQICDANCLAK